MPKFTLIAEHKDMFGRQHSKTTHEFEVDHISEVLENVDLFLRGVGFNPTGQLDYITDEFPEWTTEEWDTPQEDAELHEWTRVHRADAQSEGAEFHSNHYFDTERNK